MVTYLFRIKEIESCRERRLEKPMVDNNPTRENEPPMEPLDPPTIPAHTVALDQTAYPDLPAPTDRPRKRKGRNRRGLGCWRWIRTMLAISAMGLSLILVTGA